jgi:hypothetical protein
VPSRTSSRRAILTGTVVGTIATLAVLFGRKSPDLASPTAVSPRATPVAASAPPPSASATTTAPAITEWSVATRDSLPLRDTARVWLASNSPALPSLDLELEPGRAVRVAVVSFSTEGEHSGTFAGYVPELPNSTVIVSYVGSAEAGLVHLPAEGIAYEYRVGDDGVRRFRRLDLRQAPECALCTTPAG